MAVCAAPASAGLPVVDQLGLTKSGDTAKGGNATAIGGDGGDADTGNVQVLNGNSVALSLPGDAKSEGGKTTAKSGDAYGGDGGDAKASGGDADASDRAGIEQNSHGSGHGDDHGKGRGRGDDRGNESSVRQGDDRARGGDAKAFGGDGGDADTGNIQIGNGNSLAVSLGLPFSKGKDRGHGKGHDAGGAKSEGGDTSAKSGDAYGGDGGDAKASGGDADASDRVHVSQSNRGEDRGKGPTRRPRQGPTMARADRQGPRSGKGRGHGKGHGTARAESSSRGQQVPRPPGR